MKKFIFEYQTNYGTQVMVINAEDEEKAVEYAKMAGAWDTNNITDISGMTIGLQYESETS